MTANPNFDDILTTTLKDRTGIPADNITNNNAYLRFLDQKGNTSLVDGGETLVKELDFAENGTFKYYSGYDVLDIQPSEVLSAAEFDWKQAAVVVTISGRQMRQNSGTNRVIKLIAARIKNAERTMKNQISIGIYSDGTGSSGLQIGGLQLLVADSPSTGTVGGIDRSAQAFWQNVSFDATTDGGAAATAANIQSYMEQVWVQLVRGADNPTFIVADANYFQLFWNSLTTIQRITSTDKATSGFSSLEFAGPGGSAPVMLDQAAPTNHMYFLNHEFLFWDVHTDANFSPMEDRKSINQDSIVKPIIFMGNMTGSNLGLQGVLKD